MNIFIKILILLNWENSIFSVYQNEKYYPFQYILIQPLGSDLTKKQGL